MLSYTFTPYAKDDSDVNPSASLDFWDGHTFMHVSAEPGFTIYFNSETHDAFDGSNTVEPKGAFTLVTDNGQAIQLQFYPSGSSLNLRDVSGGENFYTLMNFNPGETDNLLNKIFNEVKKYSSDFTTSSDIITSAIKRVQVRFPWESSYVTHKCSKIHFQLRPLKD